MDSGLPAPDLKKQKLSEDADICKREDRISNLPDAVLCYILSFLSTKDAVRTSALAKRWKSVWVYVPYLDFELHLYKNYKGNNFRSYCEDYMNRFTNFLDNLLVGRGYMSIPRFRFCCYEKVNITRLYSWVCAAITCNLRELDLELTVSYAGGLPPSLFSCKTLEVLKIKGEFVFNPPFNVWLPNAKTVHLNKVVYLSDESIQKFVLGCPVLEDLLIERHVWDNLCRLEISSPSLKRLTLKVSIYPENFYAEDSDDSDDDETHDDDDGKYKVIVNAPKLEYLDFEDCLSDNIMVTDMPLVVEAHLSIRKTLEESDWRKEEECGSQVYDLLGSISNVRRLHLSGDTLQSLRDPDSHGKLPIFQNLVFLELGYDPREGPIMLPRLLKCSPKLETLVVPRGFTVIEDREYDVNKDQFYEYSWNPPEQVPECLLFSLKKVEIWHFCGGEEEEELKLVKYLLENAMVLEKMTIICHYNPYLPFLENLYDFKEELENHPRGSTNCELRVYVPRLVNSEDAAPSCAA